MSEPNTPNVALISPNTGDLVNAWGTAAINVNNLAIDGLFGGVTAIALSSSTTIALTLPSGSLAPGAGPNQSQNALIKLSGTLSGNAVFQLAMPGRYIFDNRCVVGANYVQISPSSGGGNSVGLPPGRKTMLFYDGTNVDYVDLAPEVGAYMDLATTAVPPWIITACTVPPFLNCLGGSFNTATYPALFGFLGTSTLPDSAGRARYALNQGTGRIVSGGNAIDGNTIFAGGGTTSIAQANLPSVNWNVTDNGHRHVIPNYTGLGVTGGVSGSNVVASPVQNSTTNIATTGIVVASGGSNTIISSPGFIGGITLIRAA